MLSEPIAHLEAYASRVAIYPRKGAYIPQYLFPSSQWLANGFTVPMELAHKIPAILRERYPEERITIEPSLQVIIERTLQIERQSFALSTANDAEIPEGVINVTPRPFQRAAIAYGISQGSFLNSLDMGLGKTLVAAYLAEYNKAPTLWLTKAALVLNLERELRKLTGKKVCIFSGRYPTQEDYKAFLSGTFTHYIINYEIIGTCDKGENDSEVRPWVELFNTMSSLGLIQQIVADEAHACKSTSALRTQALLRLKANRRIPMTGTAIVNRLSELWTLLHWVDPVRFNSESGFLATHARGDGSVKDPAALQKELSPYIFRRRSRDVLTDLPPVVRITHAIDMPATHLGRYKAALEMVYQAIDGNESDIANQLVQLNRLREIVAYSKTDATREYVENLLEENPDAKVLIFSNFRQPAERIADALGVDCHEGGVAKWELMAMCDRFNSDPSVRAMTLTIATGQEGLNLTAATHVVFNDLAWTPKDHSQAISRAYGRLNDLHGATAVYVDVKDTVDAFMNKLLEKKQGLVDTVDGVTAESVAQESIIRETIEWLKSNRG